MSAQSRAGQQWPSSGASQPWLKNTTENAATGQCVVDHDGRVVAANAVAQRLLRLRSDTSDSSTFHVTCELRSPTLGEQPLIHRVLRTAEPAVDPKLTVEWASGERTVLCTHAQPLIGERAGEVTAVALTFLDVTACCERSQRAHKLRTDRERVAHIKGLASFAGAIAHEFNNLLMSIVGESELAIQSLDPTHAGHGHLKHILHTARRAAELTQQLLIYSGKGRFLARPSALAQALQGIDAEVERQLGKDVHLQWALPADLPAVDVDREQLRQCMTMLVIKASQLLAKRRGTVTIGATMRYLDADRLRGTVERSLNATPGNYVQLEVSCDGKPPAASTRNRLFAPFYSNGMPGRGLGLSVVAGFARSHGGFVDLEVSPKQTMIMRIGLPARTEAEPGKVGRHSSVPPVPESLPLGILIVDDEATVRGVIAMLLSRASATTFVTGDGESALSCYAAERERIDVALVDMSMPGMNGIEVMSSLRTLAPELPVVLMSGFAADQGCKQDQTTRFLAKPFTREQLFTAIQAIAPLKSVAQQAS